MMEELAIRVQMGETKNKWLFLIFFLPLSIFFRAPNGAAASSVAALAAIALSVSHAIILEHFLHSKSCC